MKSYVVDINKNRLRETIPMSAHNIGIGRQLLDLECYHFLLSGALDYTQVNV